MASSYIPTLKQARAKCHPVCHAHIYCFGLPLRGSTTFKNHLGVQLAAVRHYHANLAKQDHYNGNDLQQQSLALWMAIKIWSFHQWKMAMFVNSLSKSDPTNRHHFHNFKVIWWMTDASETFHRWLDHMDFPFFPMSFDPRLLLNGNNYQNIRHFFMEFLSKSSYFI